MRRICRFLFYLLGLVVLALGLTLSTKLDLGVSPILSLSYFSAEVTGITIGDTTLVIYVVFILIQIALHVSMARRDPGMRLRLAILQDLLQLPLSLLFTRMINLFSGWFPMVTDPLPLRILLLLLSTVLVGTGAAMSLDMRIVANPADGLVQAVSDRAGIKLGLSKNIADISCVILTCIGSWLAVRRILGIGIGTVFSMLGTGRVIALFNRLFAGPVQWLMAARDGTGTTESKGEEAAWKS